MGAQYKPAEVERLISESREDDARLPAVPWRIDPPESAQVAAGETVVADCWVSHPSDAIDPSINERSNASAIARIRNNLRAMADQLEAARAEVERLTRESVADPGWTQVRVKSDEATYIASGRTGDTRCEACGHLSVLHNDHCCVFCTVPGCKCEWGSVPA